MKTRSRSGSDAAVLRNLDCQRQSQIRFLSAGVLTVFIDTPPPRAGAIPHILCNIVVYNVTKSYANSFGKSILSHVIKI